MAHLTQNEVTNIVTAGDNRKAIRYPASYAQQAMWFHHRLYSNDLLYNLLWQVNFTGVLYPERLLHALQSIVDRHEILRTSFSESEKGLLQVVSPLTSIDCPLEDFSTLSVEEKNYRFDCLVKEMDSTVFDLEKGPLFRFRLIRLGRDEHSLLVLMHHLVTDGSSWPVFLHELSALYAGEFLPSLHLQYGDYAAGLKKTFESGGWETHREYWRGRFSETPPILELPADKTRPAVRNFHGGIRKKTLSPSLKAGLKSLAAQNGSSLFRVLMAAFILFLYRITGGKDILIGTGLTGRIGKELGGSIGFYVNMAALRIGIEGDIRFPELLRRVHSELEEAVLHQEYPFEKVVQLVDPIREISREPLTSVSFIKLPPSREKRIDEIVLREERLFPDLTLRDFGIYSQVAPEGIRLICEYSRDIFDTETIVRFMECYETLLEGIVAGPEKRISELPILTEAERRQLLVEWNDTKADYPRDRCIHELFEEQVGRTPEAVAVVFEERHLTYRELDSRANQLARYLRKLGVGPDVPVGICIERSMEMIVGILGILKAGGAYLPLDPQYPMERLGFILEDAKTPLLLTLECMSGKLPRAVSRILTLDADLPSISMESDESPASGVSAENLAYVIFTSGSTGTPKGVETTHRGVVRLLFANDYTLFDEQQTFLHLSPINFDASTFEIWGALLHGARCILYPERVPDPHMLGKIIHEHRVSTLWLTSSLFNAIVDEAPQALQGVSKILTGGEQLSPDHIQRALKHLPDVSLINGYGPTESTTFTTCYAIPKEWCAGLAVPIGRPIANTRVYILDDLLNPVPIGVTGDLYIGGDGLARGYLNRPEQTAEKFIPDSFSDEPGARLYRSGDLARYLPDGNIEFVGRIDHQVKIRGFRIELGEIEAVLGQHPGVREAVALVREDMPGDKRLIAYVVPKAGPVRITGELRRFLAEKLPGYMVPSIFVMLESLPLTPSGKVDRRALPAPDNTRPEQEETFISPQTPVEQALAEIWGELLGLERVGVHDNFFGLGGHSLLATLIISRLHEAFGVKLPLRSIFEAPTISGLSLLIEMALWQTKARESGLNTADHYEIGEI